MTHFVNADEARGIAGLLAPFDDFAAPHRSRARWRPAALLRYPETHGDRRALARCTASPFAEVSAQQLGLQPAMTRAAASSQAGIAPATRR
jgi:hypothetical protein